MKNLSKALLKNPTLERFLLIIAFFLPLAIVLKGVIQGSIPFWYDPARDLLLGLGNLQKPTLIGPPSGIPNIFYGPFWIWLLSIGLTVSKDPRFVTFFVVTLPYFTILPFVLWKFSRYIGKSAALIIWVLFIFSTSYTNNLWSPNLAPLTYFLLLYILMIMDTSKLTLRTATLVIFAGLLAGFFISFLISFGIAVILSTGLLLLLSFKFQFSRKLWRDIRAGIPFVFLYGFGLFVALLPFFVFELRHGFSQLHALQYTLSRAILENSAVVGQVGLNKQEIITRFFARIYEIFRLQSATIPLYIVIISSLYYAKKHREWHVQSLNLQEKRLLVILAFHSLAILYIYLSSKNPVWTYHFIATEIIFLFALVILAKKIPYLWNSLVIGAVLVVLWTTSNFIKTFNQPINYPSYATKKNVTLSIFEDAHGKPFNLFIYEPAIYTYDYDYLFEWIGPQYGYIPERNIMKNSSYTTYLIIPPKTTKKVEQDFVNYRTPHNQFKTLGKWYNEDGAHILKRKRTEE